MSASRKSGSPSSLDISNNTAAIRAVSLSFKRSPKLSLSRKDMGPESSLESIPDGWLSSRCSGGFRQILGGAGFVLSVKPAPCPDPGVGGEEVS